MCICIYIRIYIYIYICVYIYMEHVYSCARLNTEESRKSPISRASCMYVSARRFRAIHMYLHAHGIMHACPHKAHTAICLGISYIHTQRHVNMQMPPNSLGHTHTHMRCCLWTEHARTHTSAMRIHLVSLSYTGTASKGIVG